MSTTSIGPRRFAVAALLSLMALVVAGCLRVEVVAEITAERTITGTYSLAFPDAMFGGTPPIDEGDIDIPDSVTIEEYSTDVDGETFSGVTYTFTNSTFDEFTTVLNGTADEQAASLVIEDGMLRFELTLPDDMNVEDVSEDDLELLEKSLITFTLTFPGEVVDTNGRLDEGTVTWESTLLDVTDYFAVSVMEGAQDSPTGAPATEESGSAPARPDVQTEEGQSSALPLIIIGATLALAVIVMAVIGLTRRRRGASSSEAKSENKSG